jgi:acyl-[acyl-carrier-protein] desaturase
MQVMPLLKPVDKCWQPADYLPASEDPDFLDKVGTRQQAGRPVPPQAGRQAGRQSSRA